MKCEYCHTEGYHKMGCLIAPYAKRIEELEAKLGRAQAIIQQAVDWAEKADKDLEVEISENARLRREAAQDKPEIDYQSAGVPWSS